MVENILVKVYPNESKHQILKQKGEQGFKLVAVMEYETNVGKRISELYFTRETQPQPPDLR